MIAHSILHCHMHDPVHDSARSSMMPLCSAGAHPCIQRPCRPAWHPGPHPGGSTTPCSAAGAWTAGTHGISAVSVHACMQAAVREACSLGICQPGWMGTSAHIYICVWRDGPACITGKYPPLLACMPIRGISSTFPWGYASTCSCVETP